LWDNHTHFLFFLTTISFFFLFFFLCLCLALYFKQQIIITTADRPHRWLRATMTRKSDAANIIIDRRLTRQRVFNDEKNDRKRAPIRNWAINNSNKHHDYHHSLFFFSFIIITISYIYNTHLASSVLTTIIIIISSKYFLLFLVQLNSDMHLRSLLLYHQWSCMHTVSRYKFDWHLIEELAHYLLERNSKSESKEKAIDREKEREREREGGES